MRNVNIAFQDGVYKKIKDLVERRRISRFVNEAVEEKLRQEEQKALTSKQKAREELRKKMIAGYKENAKNQKLQKEQEVWDETISDMWRKDNGK